MNPAGGRPGAPDRRQMSREVFATMIELITTRVGPLPLPLAVATAVMDHMAENSLGWSLERARERGVPDRDMVSILDSIRGHVVAVLTGKMTVDQALAAQERHNERLVKARLRRERGR